MKNVHEQLLEQAIEDYRRYEGLPMAVYVTSAKDGMILQANAAARELLGLTEADIGVKSVIDLYAYKEDRDYVISRMKKVAPGRWDENQTLEFKIREKRKSLRFFAKPFFSTQENDLLGCICLVFEITELERFRELQEIMPIGIFEVDRDRNVSYANRGFEKMMELTEGEEAEGRTAASFFQSIKEFEQIINELQSKPSTIIENQQVLLKTGKGGLLIVQLNVLPTYSTSGKLIKSKGIVTDITFSSLLEQAPIGLYRVKTNEEGEDIIAWANQDLAEIHGCQSPQELAGKPVSTFYPYPEIQHQFMTQLAAADAGGKILKDYYQEAYPLYRTDVKKFIINAKLIRDFEHRIVGRIGAVYDITEDIHKILSGRQQDYASWLHSYSAMLISIQQTLQAIIGGHGADVVESDRVNMHKALASIHSNVKGLRTSLNNLYNTDIVKQHLSEAAKEKINHLIEGIGNKGNSSNKEQAAWIRASAKKLREYIRDKGLFNNVAKNISRQVSENITQILRFARIISLQTNIDEIKEALLEMETFKEAIAENRNVKNYAAEINLREETEAVMQVLAEFSRIRKVQLQFKYHIAGPALIKGNRRDIYNALYNIIHNAIKYTFTKAGDELANIVVALESQGADWIIRVQNRGVPIKPEEITRKLIFKFGYRGADSGDRQRQGSGIGLWHSREIITAHKGMIDIDSEPLGGIDTGDKNLPWVTTVVIRLPQLLKPE